MRKNHGFPVIFFLEYQIFFQNAGKTRHGYERSKKKFRKKSTIWKGKIHNEVVDEDAVNALKEKIADLKKVITTMLESLPCMK